MPAQIQTTQTPKRARALDTSGNNNHGQIYSGRALEFDGVSDALSHTHTGNIEEFTVAVWINVNTISDRQNITDGSGVAGHLEVDDNGANYNFQCFDGSTMLEGGIILNKNAWYRIVLIFEKNGSAGDYKAYINGVEDTAGDFPSVGSGTYTSGSFNRVGGSAGVSDAGFNGMMSNYQIWDTVWTQADVTYDYLNPEQLALNRGGTSLTESNLKLWYPMQDGHRGQQSFVLDGSNTGLGTSIITGNNQLTGATSSDFEDIDGLESNSKHDRITVSYNDTTVFSQGALKYVATGAAGNLGFNLDKSDFSDTSPSGTYRLEFKYKVVSVAESGSTYLRFGAATSAGTANTLGEGSTLAIYSSTEIVSFSSIMYWDDDTRILLYGNDITTAEIHITDLTLQPVNAKNHATTVFYGDELIASDAEDNRTFDNDAGNWVVLDTSGGNATAAFDNNKLKVTVTDDDEVEGAQLPIVHVGDGSTTSIVAGRTYRVTMNLDYISGHAGSTPPMSIQLGNATSSNFNINSNDDSYSVDLVPVNNTDPLTIRTGEDDSFVFTVDNVSVKEVGTATGWTDADQQLDIPQTALQSYNQLAWFDGAADYVSIADHNDFSFGDSSDDDPFSISAWIIPATVGAFAIISKGIEATSGEWKFFLDSSGKLALRIYDEDANAMKGRYYDTALTANKLYHVVATYNGVGGTSAQDGINLYINGALVDDEDLTSGTYDAMVNGSAAIHIGRYNTDYANGCITETSIWGTELSLAEVQELYNDGKALDATTHSESSNLKGYWRNNGLATWTDLEGSNNGTPTSLTETILIPAGVDGSRDNQGFLMNRQKDTNALNLPDDGNSYVKVGDDDVFTFVNGGFSLECWFKMDKTPTSNGYLIAKAAVNTAANGNNAEYQIIIDPNKDLTFRIQDDSDSAFIGQETTSALTVGRWYHVVCTHTLDGTTSSTCKIYLGETATPTSTVLVTRLPSEANTYVAMENTTQPLTIGARSDASSFFFGSIDDVRIYSKELSATEITRNYNAGKRSHR